VHTVVVLLVEVGVGDPIDEEAL